MASFLFDSRLGLLQHQNFHFLQLEPAEIWFVLRLLALSWRVQVPTHFHCCSSRYPAAFPGIRSFPTAWWNIFSALVLMANEIVRLNQFSHSCNTFLQSKFYSQLEYGSVKSQQSRAVSKCYVCCYGKQIPMQLHSPLLASLVSSTILQIALWHRCHCDLWMLRPFLYQFHSSVAGGFDSFYMI